MKSKIKTNKHTTKKSKIGGSKNAKRYNNMNQFRARSGAINRTIISRPGANTASKISFRPRSVVMTKRPGANNRPTAKTKKYKRRQLKNQIDNITILFIKNTEGKILHMYVRDFLLLNPDIYEQTINERLKSILITLPYSYMLADEKKVLEIIKNYFGLNDVKKIITEYKNFSETYGKEYVNDTFPFLEEIKRCFDFLSKEIKKRIESLKIDKDKLVNTIDRDRFFFIKHTPRLDCNYKEYISKIDIYKLRDRRSTLLSSSSNNNN
jgi:hypothetical protein